MKKLNTKNKLLRFLHLIYLKLFRINDSPQRIALGFGLGVFLGILPGTGPIASLFLAFVFRLNRAAALLGSLLTNTWLSIVTFLLSIKIGSSLMRLNWHDVYKEWLAFLRDFRFTKLFELSILQIILPVIIGYIIIGTLSALLAYLIILLLIKRFKNRKLT